MAVAEPRAPSMARSHEADRDERVATQIAGAVGLLTSRSIEQMRATLPWFAPLPADRRATIGLIVQAGVHTFARYIRAPDTAIPIQTFSVAPVELARAVTLEQTVTLVRLAIDVSGRCMSEVVAAEDVDWTLMRLTLYSRDLAWAAAGVYARAAELRGAWDTRLEAAIVDAVLRADHSDDLVSRAAALGWSPHEAVAVVVGPAPTADDEGIFTVQSTARHEGMDVLASVQGHRLIAVLGGCSDALAAARTLLPAYGDGAVVAGPSVHGLAEAHLSAGAAMAGLKAVAMRLDPPRPVAAADLLPERALDGDPLARQTLTAQIYAPLVAAGAHLVDTVAAYLDSAYSVEATARRLFVHPNTVRYRLRRVAEVTGFAPTQPRDAYVLQLALALGRREQAGELL